MDSNPAALSSFVRPDGRPHTTPVWFYWDGERVYFGSQDGRRKLRNPAANPYVTLALPDPHNVVIIEGEAEFAAETEIGPVMAAFGQKYAQAIQALGMNPAEQAGFRLVRITPASFWSGGCRTAATRRDKSKTALRRRDNR
ncbi:MAG: pyridoxamine 5'-phosphate oxidase family protein [Anaerolineae bacterium]